MSDSFTVGAGTTLWVADVETSSAFTRVSNIAKYTKLPRKERQEFEITRSDQVIDVATRSGVTSSSINTTTISVSSTADLVVGDAVIGTGVGEGALIISIPDSTHFKVDVPSTATGTVTLSFIRIDWDDKFAMTFRDNGMISFSVPPKSTTVLAMESYEGIEKRWAIRLSSGAILLVKGVVKATELAQDTKGETLLDVDIRANSRKFYAPGDSAAPTLA